LFSIGPSTENINLNFIKIIIGNPNFSHSHSFVDHSTSLNSIGKIKFQIQLLTLFENGFRGFDQHLPLGSHRIDFIHYLSRLFYLPHYDATQREKL